MRSSVVPSMVLLAVVWVAGAGAALAQSADEATVQVMPGSTTTSDFAAECNDAVVRFDEATSFVLERTGETDEALTVVYEVDGSAVAGEHYEDLPGAVDFAAGEATATVAVEVLTGKATELVDLRLRVVEGSDYQPGVPDEATIRFLRPRDPSLPPPECGFIFARGDRIERRVAIGSTPERLVVEQVVPPLQIEVPPEGYRVALTGGALPPGLTLGEDGRFEGVAEEDGVYESTVEACRTEPPGTCISAALVLTVTGPAPTSTTISPTTSAPTRTSPPTSTPSTRSPGKLPATGVSSGPAVTLGAGLIGLGLALCGASVLSRRGTAPAPGGAAGVRPGRRRPSPLATWGRGRRGPGPGGRHARWRGPQAR